MNDIRRIEELGVRVVLNHKVEDILAERDGERLNAVFADSALMSAAMSIFRPGMRQGCSTLCPFFAASMLARRRGSAAASRSRGAAIRPWMLRARPAGSVPTKL
jgi:hypothetical protein